MGQLAVQILPDRWQAATAQVIGSVKPHQSGPPHIRRPTRGIQITEDTFATIRVVTAAGQNLLLVDAGSNRSPSGPSDPDAYMQIGDKRATDVYSNFLLQQITEERQEKSQILETFGEAFIFLFGEKCYGHQTFINLDATILDQ